jgi:hypothetical protein
MERVIAGSPGQPPQVITLSDAEIAARQAEETAWLNTDHRTPLEKITDAVKSLPVEKRTDVTWGAFISQCLLALQNSDMEALAYLVNGFVTEDTDYLQIIGAAKALFNL